ncbi:hypothetical protein B0T17DRAFT_252566 [Bombardia bombarda]|uniref:Dihydrodipicolinate synthase n=1 Tax=Bombardia bombarda TaxID=252184 RepID=A0AA39X014_9PEZI|nr:hypothetical protein B0T17DRAFT_252566 [Bombardia bombarda]
MATPDNNTSSLREGVLVPMLAFFTPKDEIDIPATQRHTARLLAAGVAGLVVHGSNGEAVHLTREERHAVIKAVADIVRRDVIPHSQAPFPIIAGCGAQSVKETIELCQDAKEAGATHALVLPPGYYAGIITKDQIVQYFLDVATASPVPILIYNFPAAANGVDLDSDTILRIAAHPNVVGVKLTCGNTGKMARVIAGTRGLGGVFAWNSAGGLVDSPEVQSRMIPSRKFYVFGGSADFIFQGLAIGAQGTIAGFANLAPRACVRLCELYANGEMEHARQLQFALAGADWLAIQYGFVGVKAAMAVFDIETEAASCAPRLPFKALELDGSAVKKIREGMKTVIDYEKTLEASA